MGAKDNMLIHQMDINTAFLNGKLHEEVYMKQPEGFVKEGQENLVCKLNKSLYGLKQSPRCWNEALDKYLVSLGFNQSTSDPCVYTSKDGSVILAVYVDDIILATKNECQMKEIKQKISNKFSATDMGELSYFLGVTVDQNTSQDCVWIGQPSYTKRIIEKFNMENCKPVSTPVEMGVKLSKASDNDGIIDQNRYQSAVGSLLYLSIWTRPDIAFAVNNVAKYCSAPKQEHWQAIKRILRYLQGTVEHGLKYPRKHVQDCVGYSDADWAGDTNDRKSTSGYVFQLNGTSISWRSKKQTSVALSTAEAEYMALASGSRSPVDVPAHE